MSQTKSTESKRTATEHTFQTSDGVELFFRAWEPTTPSKKSIILFHRGHEHSARWQDFIDRIEMEDCWFFAWDARGHGRSPGERGYAKSFGRMVQDAEEFVRHISSTHDIPINQMAVVAQSVGAVLATTWVHDYAPPIRALVIATPALRIKLYVPFSIPGLRLLHKFKPVSYIKSYVKPKMLTHDAEQAKLYAEDKLISPQIAVNILLGLHDTATRLIKDAGAIQVPTLLLISGRDWVVKKRPQEKLFLRLGSRIKETQTYSHFFHSTLWEKDRERPIERSKRFLEAAFDSADDHLPSLLDADEFGYTRSVYDELNEPLSKLSPKYWAYKMQSIGMKTAGRLSRGIRIGWKTGFDSGESLDHVYRDKAEGTTFFGRLIDRNYIDAPGWIGIRQRKVHIQKMLDRAIASISKRGEPVRILDIASGPGRYVLDTIANQKDVEISALLCDRDEGGLQWGRDIAKSMGITSVTYQKHDAFDGDAIAQYKPQPNIAIVSGLYELFPSNKLILDSLRGVAAAVETGGYLVYTNQPWHPQQEMIAKVLPNRDGELWAMRCRSQLEMDQLVASVGFEKMGMLIDEHGIFSVSIAKKC